MIQIGAGDASVALAKYVANLRYEDLPEALVDNVRRGVLDSLGVMVGATGLAPEARAVTEIVREGGGRKESTILGFGGRVPCWMAAFANGAFGHMLDYDDTHSHVRGHTFITTVPAAFAVAERLGTVTGRDLVTAIAAGNDVMIRIGRAALLGRGGSYDWAIATGWYSTQLLGFFSASATSAKLLGLSEDQMANAMGIAYAQASGSHEIGTGDVAHCRGMEAGFPNKAGVLAALLAQKAVSGPNNSLEGDYGLYKLYLRIEPDRESLVGELGVRFDGIGTRFKPWPACNVTHPCIEALLGMVADHNIKPEEIREIRVIGGRSAMPLLFEPRHTTLKPTTGIAAKHSMPYTLAVAAIKRRVALKDYSPEALTDPDVLDLAARVTYQPGTVGEHGGTPAAPVVQIRTKGGKLYSGQAAVVYGDAEKPMRWTALIAKFRECASFSAKRIPERNLRKAISMIENLSEVDNVTEIIRLLA